MTKLECLFDKETGDIYRHRERGFYLWSDETFGGMIKQRNYHQKHYPDRRLCEAIASKADLLRTYTLSEYIVKNTNRVGRKDSKGFADLAGICELLGISEKKTREYLNRIIGLGIIARITAETKGEKFISYAFNPVYINSCKYVPLELYVVFKKDMDAIIPDWMKSKYAEALDRKNRQGL